MGKTRVCFSLRCAGKARFNILRAALWRKQAEGSMDALIREEKRGRGERVDSPRTKPTKTVKKQKKPGILLRVRGTAKSANLQFEERKGQSFATL